VRATNANDNKTTWLSTSPVAIPTKATTASSFLEKNKRVFGNYLNSLPSCGGLQNLRLAILAPFCAAMLKWSVVTAEHHKTIRLPVL